MTTKCVVYEREFAVDPIHGEYIFCEEIFDPSHNIIIRLIGVDKPQTEPHIINTITNYVGKVNNIR